MKTASAIVIVLAATFVGCSSPESPVTCLQIETGDWPGVQVERAEEVSASDALPAHCKVTGVIDARIRFELLLPDEWNGKFMMGGGGGYVGEVVNQAQAGLGAGPSPLERGYATAGTDTGHTGSAIDARWALDAAEAEEDFAHRAVHRTVESSKAIVRDHYARPIEYAYFFGCSRGGGQAMIEAQRYPDDFDGIIAGAPALEWNALAAAFVHGQQTIYPDPDALATPVITPDNRALLEREILAACDVLDGVEDGVLDDPRRCAFTPDGLPRCAGDRAASDCVTSDQLAAIRAIYEGPDLKGSTLTMGFPLGGENDPGGWDAWITGSEDQFGPGQPSLHFAFGTQFFKYLVFDDPDWDYSGYDFSTWRVETETVGELLNATAPELSAFRDRDGKLILWHGWSDAALTALATVDYYEMAEAHDPDQLDYFRLFMMPGVGHCGAGPGPGRVDWIAAIEAWVEQGAAPERLQATKSDAAGEVLRTRPLCPHPLVAIYDGSGDPNDATSFACGDPS